MCRPASASVDEGLVHLSGLCIMDECDAESRTGRAGLVSKRLERCYLCRGLEGLQEQQEVEEEENGGHSSARQRHLTSAPSITQVLYFERIKPPPKTKYEVVLRLMIY